MKQQLSTYQARVNQKLADILSELDAPAPLLEAMRYATLNNGKRLRPALIFAMGDALQIPLEKLDTAACAMELIHSYSLVHDDLPAMDDDELRRGQPTCHIQFDEATAILVGDAQQTLAFELLCQDPILEDNQKVKMIQLLAKASGASGMVGGQQIDIGSNGQLPELSRLQHMHQLKTGALIETALQTGAVLSPNYAEKQPGLVLLGQKIGLAFQVHDDILDIEGDTLTLGKPQGSDEEADKSTYPKLMGLEKAKGYRDDLIQEAIDLLDTLEIQSDFLRELIQYISQRNH